MEEVPSLFQLLGYCLTHRFLLALLPGCCMNAVPGMAGSEIPPHLSLQLAAGAVVCVYDQDHLTSSAASLCSGEAPEVTAGLIQKYIQYGCQTEDGVYFKASELFSWLRD